MRLSEPRGRKMCLLVPSLTPTTLDKQAAALRASRRSGLSGSASGSGGTTGAPAPTRPKKSIQPRLNRSPAVICCAEFGSGKRLSNHTFCTQSAIKRAVLWSRQWWPTLGPSSLSSIGPIGPSPRSSDRRKRSRRAARNANRPATLPEQIRTQRRLVDCLLRKSPATPRVPQ
jgi:hypothetical protein